MAKVGGTGGNCFLNLQDRRFLLDLTLQLYIILFLYYLFLVSIMLIQFNTNENPKNMEKHLDRKAVK